MKILLRILFFLILAISLSAKDRIAVLDIEAQGVLTHEANMITDRLVLELVNCGKYSVLERSELSSILEEHKLQLSGITSNEFLVKVGEIANVQKMVGGQVGKVGGIFSLNARIINIETAEIENIASYDTKQAIDDVLLFGVKIVVNGLIGLGKQEEESKVTPAQMTDSKDKKKENYPTQNSVSKNDQTKINDTNSTGNITKADYQKVYNGALNLFFRKEYYRSMAVFEDIIQLNPNGHYADNSQYWIGECYYQLGLYNEAVVAFDKVFGFPDNNKSDHALFKIAMCYHQLGDFQNARNVMNKFILDFPKSDLFEQAYNYLTGLDAPKRSIFSKNKVQKMPYTTSAEYRQAYNNTLDQYFKGNYMDAIRSFKEIIASNPEGAYADNSQYWIGECYYSLEQFNESIQEFEKVFAFPENNTSDRALFKIAICYAQLGDNHLAQQKMEEFINSYPNSSLIEQANQFVADR